MAARASRKGKLSTVIVDNNKFMIKSKVRGKQYLRCCGDSMVDCGVTGYLMENGESHFKGTHSHRNVQEELAIEEFKDKLWVAVITNEDVEPRVLYDNIAIENAEVAAQVPFISVERSMGRWRRQCRPKIPATLAEFQELVNDDAWIKFRQYHSGTLTVQTLEVQADTTVTILGDEAFLASVPAVTELYLDATFKICPTRPHVAQFLTIMGQIDDSAIPLAWACMTRKSEPAYIAVFRYFRSTLAPHVRPTVVHMDFERSEENAIRVIYPGVEVVHCFFHYNQAMFRQLKKKLGNVAMERINNWGLAQSFFRKLIALALLRAADIRASYYWLLDNTALDIRQFFARFLQYYEEWWLTRLGPERFSVYGHNHRTNNSIEAYHRVLHQHLGTHPGIWKFTAKIRELQAKACIEVASLNRGLAIRRPPSRAYTNYDTVLKHATRLYSEGSLSIPRFLSCANHFLLAFRNPMTITTIEQVNEFITNPAHDIAVQPVPKGIERLILHNDDPNERFWIPIIREHAPDEEINILILEDLNRSRCNRCGNSILNYMSLPCEHWFGCENCTENAVMHADEAGLVCPHCGVQCVAFQIEYTCNVA